MCSAFLYHSDCQQGNVGNNREIRHKASRDFAQSKYHRRRKFVSYKALVEHMAEAGDTRPTVDINDAPDADAAAVVSEAGGPPELLLLLYRTYKALFSYIKARSKALYTMNRIIIDSKNKA